MRIIFKSGGRAEKVEEHDFRDEEEFRREIVANDQLLFGSDTVLLDVEREINKSGGHGPKRTDGFLFDWSDKNDPRFYLIEIELARHNWRKHIYPQITGFLEFYESEGERRKLSQKLYEIIHSDNELRNSFEKFVGGEIFKFVVDLIDASRNILVVMDRNMPEFQKMRKKELHEHTWGRRVKYMVVRKYTSGEAEIFHVESDAEVPGTGGGELPSGATIDDRSRYTEEGHMGGVDENIQKIYQELKDRVLQINLDLDFNPTQQYIALRMGKNPRARVLVYIKTRVGSLKLEVKRPADEVRECITKYEVLGGSVWLDNLDGMDEVIDLLMPLIQKQ